MHLIKVKSALDQIEKPLLSPWWKRAGSVMYAAAFVVMCAGFIRESVPLLVVCFLLFIAGALFSSGSWVLLPAAARRFRAGTHEEYRALVRRTEAFNRAWCLAERGQKHLPESRGHDPFQSGYEKLRLEVDAYAHRYRAVVAPASAGVQRCAMRKDIVDRAGDLVELEAKLDELGKDADPDMRARARAMREAVEKDCLKANLPIGLVRSRRASSPTPLPAARVVAR